MQVPGLPDGRSVGTTGRHSEAKVKGFRGFLQVRQLGGREARQSASSTCRYSTSSEEHERGDRGREARAVVKEASDQEKNSCGQGGRERQGQAERQAKRQRRYQVKLGQFQDMLADTSPDSCSAAWLVAARVVAVVQEPSHLGLLCCYLLSRPSLDLQLRRQFNLLPPPMPFVPVLSVRAVYPAASAFPDDSIFSLGLSAAVEALRPSWDSVPSATASHQRRR